MAATDASQLPAGVLQWTQYDSSGNKIAQGLTGNASIPEPDTSIDSDQLVGSTVDTQAETGGFQLPSWLNPSNISIPGVSGTNWSTVALVAGVGLVVVFGLGVFVYFLARGGAARITGT